MSGLVLAVASAALYSVSQPPFGLWCLSYVSLVPWLLSLDSATGARRAAASGFLFGANLAVICGAWVPEGLREVGVTPVASHMALALGAILVKGLPYAALGAFAFAVRGRVAWRLLGIPAALSLLEWIASIPPWGLPWVLLGHSQAPVQGIAQLAGLGGVPLVSAVVAFVNVAAACALREGPRSVGGTALVAGVAGVVVVAMLVPPFAEATSAQSPAPGFRRVRIVQPEIPRGERWMESTQRTNLAAALEAADGRPADSLRPGTLVIFPEMLVTTPLEREPLALADLQDFARRRGVEMIAGVALAPHSLRDRRYRNSVVWIDEGGRVVATMTKALPVPLVESEREVDWWPALAWLYGSGARAESGEPPGPMRARGEFAVVLCYEALFPGIVDSRRTEATDAILVLADESWVSSTAAAEQALASATFRAIEQRLPLLRVAMRGPSAAIDPRGRRTAQTPTGRRAILDIELRVPARRSRVEAVAPLAFLALGGALGWGATRLRWDAIAIRRQSAGLLVLLAVASGSPSVSSAEDIVGTLTLDPLSFVSFGNREVYSIPPGSSLRFRFDKPESDGSIPFVIDPADVSIGSIRPPGQGADAEILYGIAERASGRLRRRADGAIVLEFDAQVTARLLSAGSSLSHTYTVRFTTERAVARSADEKAELAIEGMNLVTGAGHVQLVGAATNQLDSTVEPGAAVYTVLSGRFDRLPKVPTP